MKIRIIKAENRHETLIKSHHEVFEDKPEGVQVGEIYLDCRRYPASWRWQVGVVLKNGEKVSGFGYQRTFVDARDTLESFIKLNV